MSHYTNLAGDGNGVQSFLWQVNQLHEVVVYTLDASGKPGSFCTGTTISMMAAMLAQHMPDYAWVNSMAPEVFGSSLWRDVARALNGEIGGKRKIIANHMRLLGSYHGRSFDTAMSPYVGYNREQSRFVVTEKGEKYDAQYD